MTTLKERYWLVMTTNKTPRKKQAGSAAIEFPFAVPTHSQGIILWGLVARLSPIQPTETQLDNVTYNLVNAVSLTQLKPEQGPNGLPNTLKDQLLDLAERYLPQDIKRSNIGLVLESRVDTPLRTGNTSTSMPGSTVKK